MKKILLTLTLALTAIAAGAQTMYDALTFGENDYLGSARSMALGNAVTALGGDLGMAGINPAAPAVAGYSQLIITPGFSISATSSSYAPVQGGAFGAAQRSSLSKFALPNIGISTIFPTGNLYGLRSMTFTVTANSTANYTDNMENVGVNSQTSKFAEFASAAEGIYPGQLTYDNYGGLWDVVNAYESGTIAPYTGDGMYIGSSEYLTSDKGYHYIPGALTQTNTVKKYGTKTDLVFGFSFNISDRFYWGLNMGIPMIEYDYFQSYREVTQDPNQFPAVMVNSKTGLSETTYYDAGLYQYEFSTRMSGLYGKIGFISLPMDGLRIGAAIQTPVSYSVSENWQYSGQVSYMDTKYSTSRTYSPLSTNKYTFRGPWEINAGAAYVFGTRGLVSVDYEMTDYSHMNIHSYSSGENYLCANYSISNFCGVSHSLRAGVEVNLNNWLAVRFGGSVVSSPEKSRTTSDGKVIDGAEYAADFENFYSGRRQLLGWSYSKPATKKLSAGVGYSAPGGFFVDLALRLAIYPTYTYNPYYSYPNYDKTGARVDTLSPEISCTRRLWSAALSFGWKF